MVFLRDDFTILHTFNDTTLISPGVSTVAVVRTDRQNFDSVGCENLLINIGQSMIKGLTQSQMLSNTE